MCFQISAMNQNNGTIEFHYYECACQIKHILQKSRAGWFIVCKKKRILQDFVLNLWEIAQIAQNGLQNVVFVWVT